MSKYETTVKSQSGRVIIQIGTSPEKKVSYQESQVTGVTAITVKAASCQQLPKVKVTSNNNMIGGTRQTA